MLSLLRTRVNVLPVIALVKMSANWSSDLEAQYCYPQFSPSWSVCPLQRAWFCHVVQDSLFS